MRVKGYNTIGGGPNTENLVVMTAKALAPLPPQDLVVTQEGTDFFAISWLPPYPPYVSFNIPTTRLISTYRALTTSTRSAINC